jgi:hypothetical protein
LRVVDLLTGFAMTTLHFERDDEDELRKAGMSKELGCPAFSGQVIRS